MLFYVTEKCDENQEDSYHPPTYKRWNYVMKISVKIWDVFLTFLSWRKDTGPWVEGDTIAAWNRRLHKVNYSAITILTTIDFEYEISEKEPRRTTGKDRVHGWVPGAM